MNDAGLFHFRSALKLLTGVALVLGIASANAQESATQRAQEALHESVEESMHEALVEEGSGAADHSDASHGDAGHTVNTNPLATDPDLAIYTAVVFLLLFLVLAKFAWRPISEGLDRRERSIAEQIAAADRIHDEAKGLLAQYEQRLANAQEEVRAMIDEARHDATHTSQDILAKANAESQVIRDRAVRDIDTAKGVALKELAETSGRLAVGLAEKIIRHELDPSRHRDLIQEAMDRFPAVNGHN